MPETEVTREQLLASVHRLEPGDLLVVKVPSYLDQRYVHELVDAVRGSVDGTGVRALIVSGDLQIEAWRQGETPDEQETPHA